MCTQQLVYHVDFIKLINGRTTLKGGFFPPPDYPVIKLTSSSVSEAALFLEFHKVWTDLIDKLLTAGSAHVSLGTDIEIHLAKAHLGYSRLVILLL